MSQKQQGAGNASFLPRALVYRAVVPWEVIDEFSCREVWSQVRTVLDDEQWCLAHKEKLSEALFSSIYLSLEAKDEKKRRRLIQLRRDLYNLRPPTNQQMLQEAEEYFSLDEKELFREYTRRCQHIYENTEKMDMLLQHAFSQARSKLWNTLLQTTALQKGIALISPELYQQAYRSSCRPAIQQVTEYPHTLRKEEATLLLYLTRMATKTSAFSTLTSVASTQCVIGTDPHFYFSSSDASSKSVIAVNHLPFVLLTYALASHPQIRCHLPISINPYCNYQDDRLSLLRLSSQVVRNRMVTYEQIERVALKVTPLIRRLLAHIMTAKQPCTLHSLREWLYRLLSDQGTAGEKMQAAEQLITQLLEFQVLLFDSAGMHSQTLLPNLIAQLEAIPEEPASPRSPLLDALNAIQNAVQDYPEQAADQRVVTRQRIVTLIETCFNVLTAPFDPQVVQLPLYEESVLTNVRQRLVLPGKPELYQDLHLFASILPLFDNLALTRAALTAFFLQTSNGRGQPRDLLEFLGNARSLLSQAFLLQQQRGRLLEVPEILNNSPDVGYLLQLRAEFLNALSGWKNSRERVVELDRAHLHRIADSLPASATFPQQWYASMGQWISQEQEDLFIVNRITDGWGKQIGIQGLAFGENELASDHLAALLQQQFLQSTPADSEFVELPGYGGFNGNLHLPLTQRELVLPNQWSGRPRVQQMLLTDLAVMYESSHQRLRLVHKREGTAISLLYLGLLAPELLGPFHRLLLPFTQIFFWRDRLLLEALMKGNTPQDNQVISFPRICLGQLVLSRRKWLIPASLWPQWKNRKWLSTSQLLDIERWRLQVGIPEQVYVSPALSIHVKPQFIDFHHMLLLSALPRRLSSKDGWLRVEEALPAPGAFPMEPDGRHFATTFWIETR